MFLKNNFNEVFFHSNKQILFDFQRSYEISHKMRTKSILQIEEQIPRYLIYTIHTISIETDTIEWNLSPMQQQQQQRLYFLEEQQYQHLLLEETKIVSKFE